MTEAKRELTELTEQLALQSIMVEPGDLPALGGILEMLEKAISMAADDFPTVRKVCEALQTLAQKIVLSECPDPHAGIGLLGAGVKLMQKQMACPDHRQVSEEESFWKEWEVQTKEKAFANAGDEPSEDSGAPGSSLAVEQDLEFYKDFISEALEHLGTIELNLINLEQSPGNKEHMNSIFRPFHTIKGVSGFLNLLDIQKFSHAMESLLDEARNEKLQITQEMVDFILESVDQLKHMILDLGDHIESGRVGTSTFDLTPYFNRIDILKKSGPAPNAMEAGSDGANLDGRPAGLEAENRPHLGEILSSQGLVSPSDISVALKEQQESGGILKLGEILIKEKKAKPEQVLQALREQRRASPQFNETSVKVDTDKLDNLVDMIGELVIAQSQIEQNPVFGSLRDQKLMKDFSQLKRITTDLQKISMSLRMVPIRQTFQKMVRLVRDLAKKSEKLVELTMSGEETEIDRNMVESLYDPLIHMIRNAIDHGIEPPAERRATGKPETGNIFLKAYQKGGNVIIEIEDDGQGLNREKIFKKARERGLIADEAQLSDYQIDQLIFEPGFSTADQVTDVSGRGVGMDVVKRTIEKLRGKVEIFSNRGEGTRFLIRIPLTLAIMDGIVVSVGGERYILPTVFIKETLKPRREEIFSVHQKGDLVKVRENLLPLIRLHQLLGIIPQKQEPWETLVIVVENEGLQKCLMVDDLIGKQEVVIKNLGEKLKDVKGVAGATIMGDGRAGIILDVHGIFEIDQASLSSRERPAPCQNGGARSASATR